MTSNLGIYHHPDVDDARISCFYPANVFVGGTLYMNADAINEYYVRGSWSDINWAALGHWLVQNAARACGPCGTGVPADPAPL